MKTIIKFVAACLAVLFVFVIICAIVPSVADASGVHPREWFKAETTIDAKTPSESSDDTSETEMKYTEAIVSEDIQMYQIDIEKSFKNFGAHIGDDSVSGKYLNIEKTRDGFYLLYVYAEGEHFSTFVKPDKVETGDYAIKKVTTSVLREYEDGTKEVRWKEDVVLYIPEGTMINEIEV